jgi:uncharacterized membrane protein
MAKGRLEAFSDGVIAILITIMILELKVPHGADWASLRPLVPVLLTYVLSFVFLGIYWNNHHHMLHAADHVDGAMLWANHHLLFWLSLVPLVTNWMGETHFAPIPVATYGGVLLACGLSFVVLERTMIRGGRNPRLAKAVGADLKGTLSVLFYAVAIPVAFVQPGISEAIYVIVALIWLVPDPRIESALGHKDHGP